MKKKNWYKPKPYTHITSKLSSEDASWIKGYVSDQTSIAQHSFFPLLHRTIFTKRFKEVGRDENNRAIKSHFKVKDGVKTSTAKIREIFYSNHLDAHVYSYYTQKILEPFYEAELKKNKSLNESVLAYRRIPVPDTKRFKCNIDFANDTFEQIKIYPGKSAVLALDISQFFDSLDHKILKKAWTKLIGRSDLPPDQYNLYKSLTHFAYVEMRDMLDEFGYKHPNELITDEIGSFVQNGEEFRNRIKQKGYIKTNPFRKIDPKTNEKKAVGIPQGTPMSALLANLYLLEFDKRVLSLLESCEGIYRRYSDDILIICPKQEEQRIEEEVYNLITDFNLEIQRTKTQKSFFHNSRLIENSKPIVYLGFQFNGHRKLIKSTSISKFYRKMKSSIRYRAFLAKTALAKRKRGKNVDATIHKRTLYALYTFKGSIRDSKKKRNFISYVNYAAQIMDSPEIQRQLSKAWGIFHKEINAYERWYKLPLGPQTDLEP